MLRLVGSEIAADTPDRSCPGDAGSDVRSLLTAIGRICLELAGGSRDTGVVTFRPETSPSRQVGPPRNPTRIEEDLDAWGVAHIGAMAVGTQRQVKRLVRELAQRATAADLGDITNDHVCAYIAAMQLGDGRKKCSGKSITTYTSYLHAFFEWAVQTERIRRNPAEHIPKVRWIRKKQRAATPTEVAKILGAATFEQACMLRFLAVSGLRPLHAEQLRVRNFMLDEDPPRAVIMDTKTL